MRLTVFIFGLLAVLISGCAETSFENPSDRRLKGTVTPEGHLIFYEWMTAEFGKQHHYAALKDDYGMMIFYKSSMENAMPRFELYS